MQARFYVGVTWGRGQLSPNLGLAPKCDIKLCLTNSKYLHIRAKKSVLWPSKYTKMRFRLGFYPGPRWGAHESFQTSSMLGRGHISSYPIPTLDSLTFGTSICGALPPKYFSRTVPDLWKYVYPKTKSWLPYCMWLNCENIGTSFTHLLFFPTLHFPSNPEKRSSFNQPSCSLIYPV